MQLVIHQIKPPSLEDAFQTQTSRSDQVRAFGTDSPFSDPPIHAAQASSSGADAGSPLLLPPSSHRRGPPTAKYPAFIRKPSREPREIPAQSISVPFPPCSQLQRMNVGPKAGRKRVLSINFASLKRWRPVCGGIQPQTCAAPQPWWFWGVSLCARWS